MDNTRLHGVLAFIRKAENLKNTLRSAYTSQGKQESSAEHSWRLSLFALVSTGFFHGIDGERLLQLAIIHDLAEAVCGDTPAPEQAAVPHKAVKERQAIREICADLPQDLQTTLLALWNEYEEAKTPESRIIKGLDKLETIMQHNQGQNPEFFDYGFNLAYGQEYTGNHPFLAQLRAVLDAETQHKAKTATKAE